MIPTAMTLREPISRGRGPLTRAATSVVGLGVSGVTRTALSAVARTGGRGGLVRCLGGWPDDAETDEMTTMS